MSKGGSRGIYAPEMPAQEQSGFSRGPFARDKLKSRIAQNYSAKAHNREGRNPGQSLRSGEEKWAEKQHKNSP
jgi:hypothetical protein